MAARKWTMEQRKTQSQAIKKWKSWDSSTGPRTVQGKKKSSQNSFQHGCDSMWVKILRQFERDIRRSRSASVSANKELEAYRREVEKRIAENALRRGEPKILVKAFGFLSAEISRSTKKMFHDLEFFEEHPDGLGTFIRKFEWEMAKLRAYSSFVKNTKSGPPIRWEKVEIPDNTPAT